MSQTIHCTGCQKPLAIKPEWSGKRIKCPACQTTLTAPLRAVPIVASRPAPPIVEEEVIDLPPTPKPAKPIASKVSKPSVPASSNGASPLPKPKKKKKSSVKTKSPSKLLLGLVIGAGVLMLIGAITLIAIYVPFWNAFASKEVQVVDLYTAVNGLRYHDVGERTLQSSLTSYSIPGRRKLMVTRPDPQGEYLLLNVKLPYKDVDEVFAGSKGRNYLTPGAVQLNVDGQWVNALFVQPENDNSKGYFQLDYSPKGDTTPPLEEFLGPKKTGGWPSDGDQKPYDGGFIFSGRRGLEVKVSLGGERQDGRKSGNIVNDLTGHKIMRDQDNLVAGASGYIHVSWNQGSTGWIVDDDLEQPNELGLNWDLHLLFPKPKSGNSLSLKMLNKTRTLKIP